MSYQIEWLSTYRCFRNSTEFGKRDNRISVSGSVVTWSDPVVDRVPLEIGMRRLRELFSANIIRSDSISVMWLAVRTLCRKMLWGVRSEHSYRFFFSFVWKGQRNEFFHVTFDSKYVIFFVFIFKLHSREFLRKREPKFVNTKFYEVFEIRKFSPTENVGRKFIVVQTG